MSSVGMREHSFILVCNRSSTELSGFESSEVLHKTLSSLFPLKKKKKKKKKKKPKKATSTNLYNLISISNRNSHLKFLPVIQRVEPVSGVLGKSLPAAGYIQQVALALLSA